MGSFNGKGRDGGPGRRERASRDRRRPVLPIFEDLEDRRLLTSPPTWKPTSLDIGDIKNGPLANAGGALIKVYQDYQKYTQNGGANAFASSAFNSQAKYLKFLGDYVAVQAHGFGDLQTYFKSLQSMGMVIGGFDAKTMLVEGLLPIAKLPSAAALNVAGAQTVSLAPQMNPVTESVGSANNQGEQAMLADTAKTQFGVNGKGVTVGVISDSASKFAGGLADSVKTGDLPANPDGTPAVNVLFDFPGTGSDEGRAMLEEIYDIAPGAGLAFHAAASLTAGETNMAAGVRRLATEAGSKVITDDITFPLEPYYQDGVIAQAMTDVTNLYGVTVTSSAGNRADHGIESPFRPVNGTVTGLGAGRFMDWDPGATTNFLLPVTVNAPGPIVFQYDNPWYVNGVTADLDFYLLDANGAIVASGTDDNLATQQPVEFLNVGAAGTYNMVVQVKAGSPDVGRIVAYQVSNASDIQFSHQYGNAGGITYVSTIGHHTADSVIGTAAVAWYDTPAFPSGKTPTPNEDFSSYGPSYKVFNSDGSRKASVELQQKPDLSGPDGINTSFFPPGGQGQAPPGLPANNYNLPNFYGTSAAAPNVAAIVALMDQLAPNTPPAAIKQALITSTIPVNTTPKGQWDPHGGYGFVQATTALQAVDNLRVIASSPLPGSTVTTAPQYIIFTFNRDVDVTTLNASDLVYLAPAGVTVHVGQPLVDLSNKRNVFFPVSFDVVPGAKANGAYAFTLAGNSITSADKKPLVQYSTTFAISDAIAPRVLNTSFSGRFAAVTFSEPINPSTLTRSSFYLIRAGGVNVPFGDPRNVIVNQDPRLAIGYDSASNTAFLILTGLDQSQLPTDHYALVVLDTVTDTIGNKLDGEFGGIFPSGNGKEGGNFTQDLGVLVLSAPQIISLGLAQDSDSGILGDQNTNTIRPTFTGQVLSKFPAAIGGLTVVAQFSGVRGSTFDLGQGLNGRGFVGTVDVQTTTDATGHFTFQAPFNLPAGFQAVRVVVVGASDQPPLPGLSATLDSTFRIDTNDPIITPDVNSIQQNAKISGLATVTLDAVDGVVPTDLGNPLSIPTSFVVPALDPQTATNISNYRLVNLGSDNALGGTGAAADTDYSSYITSAVYTSTTRRTTTADPYTGTITLSFAPGVPAGKYDLIAKRGVPGVTAGLTDAAGNGIFALQPDGKTIAPTDFILTFDLQPTPVYITQIQAVTPDPNGTKPDPNPTNAGNNGGTFTYSNPRSYFEVGVPGNEVRATAPPTEFFIDFSNPLDTTKDYTNLVQLIRSANSANAAADGDFGVDPTFTSGVGYTRVAGTSVTLVNSVLGATFGSPGYKNRLILTLPAGTTLAPDHYRIYVPNQVTSAGLDLRVLDQFGSQLDGEFIGNPSPNGDGTFENLLPTGEIRPVDLTGDGVPGGAFETGYTIVPNGNVIFARPDYVDDPSQANDDPDGSINKPYAALAPEATVTDANGGDLNSFNNFLDPTTLNYDRNGNGRFDRSAFVAAETLSARGPVVIVAEPSSTLSSRTFVLQAPSGTDPVLNDGSATVPYNTDLVFQPGSILKLRNASLFVQNQGSAMTVLGGPNPLQKVYFTSYSDDSVGGDTNNDGPSSQPQGGDWGGIVFRNFDDTSNGGRIVPLAPGPQDPLRPKLGISGADEALSSIDHSVIRYGGGAVPQTIGFRYDAITNFNARPSITNVNISLTGGVNGAQAAISGDVDSFREDDLARGILVRRAVVANNSINGIYVRAEINGVAEPTDAIFRQDNPANRGGTQNYTFFAPLPYVLVSRMVIGQVLLQDTNGQTRSTANRFYFQPGTEMKFQRGAAIDQITAASSLNIGDRTYIKEYDANNNFAPGDPGFRPADFGDANVVFTSFFDDLTGTSFRDPNTGALTTIVAPIDSDNGGTFNEPVPGNVPPLSRWGGISVTAGALAVIDEANFLYGGGSVNNTNGTIPQRDVLAFENAFTSAEAGNPLGTRAYVTNNNYYDNLQAPISVDPNGLLAADPLRPLRSGNPFFRGNVMQRNEFNALEVLPGFLNNSGIQWFGYTPNVFANTVWDDTDSVYLLRSTIRLAGRENFGTPLPAAVDTFTTELKPSVTLTVQSSLPGSLLANGQSVPRPGESAIVKLLNTRAPLGDGLIGMPGVNQFADSEGGAGWIVGEDDGVDPPPPPDAGVLVDGGYLAQLRFVGIGGNQTTGQQRVPVVVTSARDDTAGRTVRGIDMFKAVSGNTTAPAPGDGGVILFGALSLSDYNLLDPRDGNLIDNADIRYMSRIEQQGGGWVMTANPLAGGSYNERTGRTANTQYNTAKAMTVSNSNIAYMSQAGFIAHPSYTSQLPVDFGGNVIGTPARPSPVFGEPTLTYLVNNTFSNSPMGVRIVGDITVTTDAQPQESPAEAIVLNNTFYNNGDALHLEGAIPTPQNPMAHVYAIAMNNLFANSTNGAIVGNGRTSGGADTSKGQYNFFTNNANDVILTNGAGFQNAQPVTGNAGFRNPQALDFTLLPTSDAIDSSRAEIGPLLLGNSLQPIVTQTLDANGGVRRPIGRQNAFGANLVPQNGVLPASGDIISLPGYPLHNGPAGGSYYDQWVPAIPGSAGAIPGPTSNAGSTYSYIPIAGERDQAGQLRIDDPAKANVGFGSRPFFDIGANEYIRLTPPHILTTTATINNPNVTTANPASATNPAIVQIPFYTVGGLAGANQTPHQILIQLDQRVDPATVNNKTITLTAANGDGVFDNGNDKNIDLSGKLFYDVSRNVIIVALADTGLSLANDSYRLEVFGSGGNVLRNPQGLALDGENTVGDQPNGPTLTLPSGDGFPGGNFFLPFTIDTHPPQIVSGSFALAGSTDTGARDAVTANNRPSFIGTVTDIAPPANPLLGQTVFIDVMTGFNGVFDRLGVAKGTTDANGNFTATFDPAQAPLPDTNINVGPDGLLGTGDDTGYFVARVRIVDQSGNVSSPSDAGAQIGLIIDTKGPRVTGSSPLPGALAAGGTVPIAITVNENLLSSSVSTNSIKVVRAGGDGVFGNANDVPVAIDPTSIVLDNLHTASGAEILRFNVTGATASDVYRVTVSGSAGGVTDVAGNLLDGEGNGFPSGDGTPGGDFNLNFIVFNPASSRNLFVSQGAAATGTGARSSPFPTITAALAAALPGDTVAVLPGVYTESIALKSLVRLTSADATSTQTNVVPGNALQTIIRAPSTGSATTTITGTDLFSISAFSTEVTGFTIASPLNGNSATGPINTGSFAALLTNSNVLFDKNYIVDSGVGIGVNMGGNNASAPRFESNGFIGNITGLLVNDVASTSFLNNRNVEVANNDFAFNTYGYYQLTSASTGPQLADVVNNIFWQNRDNSGSRGGTGIAANAPGRMTVRGNLFSGNGPSDSSPNDDSIGVGGSFNPAALTAAGDANGNRTGSPAFLSPIDPRPDAPGGGPGNFFLGANFDIGSTSAAIDAAINSAAPARDFRNRGRVDISTVLRPGYGPADIGAFEFGGSTGSGSGSGSGGSGIVRDVVLSSSDGDVPSVPAQTSAAPSVASNATVANAAVSKPAASVVVSTPAATATSGKHAKKKVAAKPAHKAATQPIGPIAAARRFFVKKKG